MRITNGFGWPVTNSFGGDIVNIDIYDGPDTTVANLVLVTDTVIIVVTNEFGDVVANQIPVWVGMRLSPMLSPAPPAARSRVTFRSPMDTPWSSVP